MSAPALNLKHLAWASFVPAVFLVLATVFKPLWRDEYWSLFYSAPEMSLTDLATEVHPPAYYLLLRAWRILFESDFGVRLLSFPLLALGALTVWRLIDDKREAAIFLLLSLGSYWVVYFASEIRPYLLIYGLSAITVCLVVQLVEKERFSKLSALALCLVGGVLCVSHYFGALWFCVLCAVLGVYFAVHQKSAAKFGLMALIGVIGIAPCIAWIALNLQAFDVSSQASGRAFLGELEYASNQFLRGLLAKLIGSNPLALLAGLAGVYGAIRFRDRALGVLSWAVLGTVAIAFAIHFGFVTMIKERAFVVIMPALIFLASRQIVNIKAGSGWRAGFLKYAPIAALIMPFLFIPEYFKDREKMGELKAVISQYGDWCEGTPLLVYNRPSHHPRYAVMVNERILGSKGAGFKLIEVTPDMTPTTAPETGCPIKAAALILERGGGESYDAALKAFERGGLDIHTLHQDPFGKRRNLLLVDVTVSTGGE